MSERFHIHNGRTGAIFTEFSDPDDLGHGKDGYVKKASFWGREVTVQGHNLNAGSLIDFLNAKHGATLKKGWFFGLGGSSKEEIQAVFNKQFQGDIDYPKNLANVKESFVNMNPNANKYVESGFMSMATVGDEANVNKVHILTPNIYSYDPYSHDLFEGIFITPRDSTDPTSKSTLHICLNPNKFQVTAEDILEQVIAPLFAEALERLADSPHLPRPTNVCCDYDHYGQIEYVKEWQRQNGRVEMEDV